MKTISSVLFFITIFLPIMWSIYVPELVQNNIKVNGGVYVTTETERLQSFNLNHIKLNNNDSGNNNDVSNDGQKRVLTTHQAKTNIHHSLPTPIEEKSYDIADDVVVSEQNHTVHAVENLEAQPTSLAEWQQHKIHNNDVVTAIIEEKNNQSTLQHKRQRRQLSDLFIAPNTRWCGRGNTANGTYNHLGGASMADKCCRTHDHCKFYIPAMSNRYDLFNYRPYTLSHCNCDRRFRTCLKMANDEDANTIGKLFFNLVQTQCFVLAKKDVVCQQQAPDGTCLKEHIKQKAYLRSNKKY